MKLHFLSTETDDKCASEIITVKLKTVGIIFIFKLRKEKEIRTDYIHPKRIKLNDLFKQYFFES